MAACDDNVIEFRRAIRRYDPADVDRIVTELSARVDRFESERLESARLVQRLTRELAEAHKRSSQMKPSFAELGTTFEETVRVAEKQAGKMLADAAEEASERLSKARSESTRLRTQSTRESQAILTEAHQKAEELRLETDRVVVQARQRSQEEMQSARAYCEHLVSTTVSRASTITRDTDDLINSMTMDSETQLSDLRRQQHILDQYVQRMRALAVPENGEPAGVVQYAPPAPRIISA